MKIFNNDTANQLAQGALILLVLATGYFTVSAVVDHAQHKKAHLDALAEKFTDPDSMRYKDINTTKYDRLTMTCGKVNAKNKMGGYVGYRAFIVTGYKNPQVFMLDEPYSHSTTIRNAAIVAYEKICAFES